VTERPRSARYDLDWLLSLDMGPWTSARAGARHRCSWPASSASVIAMLEEDNGELLSFALVTAKRGTFGP
jgi:hypothetical protein